MKFCEQNFVLRGLGIRKLFRSYQGGSYLHIFMRSTSLLRSVEPLLALLHGYIAVFTSICGENALMMAIFYIPKALFPRNLVGS